MNNCSTLHSTLNDFREDGKYCDVTIQVAAETFQCHRVILASASMYFDTMFSAPFKESYVKDITLHNIDAEAFAKILDFAYTGCKPIITEENAYNLLTTSDFLIVPVIKDYCMEFILENLDRMKFDNLIEMMVFTSNIEEFNCSNDLMNYIVKHFNIVSQDYDFLKMPFDELDWLVSKYERAMSEYTACRDQNIFLDALIRWVCHSREERAEYFEEFAKTIDFERISEEYIAYMTKEYKINVEKCRNGCTLKKCIIDFLTLSSDNREHFDTLPISYGTLLLGEKLRLHAFVHCKSRNRSYFDIRPSSVMNIFSMSKYEPDWFISCTQESPFQCENIRIISVGEPSNHDLYCLQAGGYYSFLDGPYFSAHSSVDVWSASNKRILTSPPFEISSSFEMCGMRNNIYLYSLNNDPNFSQHRVNVPVTLTEEEIRRDICYYSCELDQWFPVPEMKIKMDYSCITADDNLVYLIGGENFSNSTLEGYVQAYDYRTPKWIELSKTNSLYSRAACCMLDGKIYVSDAQKVEAYDPVAGKWEIISTISHVYKNSNVTQRHINRLGYKHVKRMVSFENMLWIISSFEDAGDWCYTSIIDPREQTWRISRLLEAAIRSAWMGGYDYESDDQYIYAYDEPRETFVTKEVVVF